MGINHHVGGWFLVQIAEQLREDEMLEHIGVITCVETVAVAEHDGNEAKTNRILPRLATAAPDTHTPLFFQAETPHGPDTIRNGQNEKAAPL
jgi:hypothetical protein